MKRIIPLVSLLPVLFALWLLWPSYQEKRQASALTAAPLVSSPKKPLKGAASNMALSPTYIVSGAGNAAVNGTYTQDGVDPYYSIAWFDNGFARLLWGGDGWHLRSLDGLTSFYDGTGDVENVPASGWSVYPGADAPAPTVSGVTAPDAPSAPTFNSITQTTLNVVLPALPTGAATLNLERSPAGAGTWTEVATGQAGGATVAQSGLTADTAYDYRAVAVGAGGETNGTSAEVTTLPAAPDAPLAPTFSLIGTTTLRVTMPALSTGAATLNLQRSLSGADSWTTLDTGMDGGDVYNDSGLLSNTEYNYRAVAVGAGGSTNGAAGTVSTESASSGGNTMTNGLDSARQNGFYTAPEAVFMVPDYEASLYFRRDLESGGNGFSEMENWVTHIADGHIDPEGYALVGAEGQYSGTFTPTYGLLEQVARNLCGLPYSDTLIDTDTRQKLVWRYPANVAPAIETWTGYFGKPDSAYRLTGGKITDFNIDVRRIGDGGTLGGSMTIHFNRVEVNKTIDAMEAGAEVQTITFYNVPDDQELTLVDGADGADTAAITAGDNNAAWEAAIESLDGYDGFPATVTGTLASSTVAGVAVKNGTLTVTFTGNGNLPQITVKTSESQLVTVVGGSGNYTIAGSATFAIGDATAAIQTKVRAMAGNFADVVVLGESSGTTASWLLLFPYSVGNIAATAVTGTGATLTTVTTGAAAAAATFIKELTTRNGSTGNDAIFDTTPYLHSDDVRYYLATDDDDLATIDMTDLPDEYGNDGDSHLLSSAGGATFSMSDLWNVYYGLNVKRYATQFAPGARTTALGLTLPHDMTDGSDMRFIRDTADACMATGFWIRRAVICDDYEWWEDVYVGRSDVMGRSNDSDLYFGEIPLVKLNHPDNNPNLVLTLILPVA